MKYAADKLNTTDIALLVIYRRRSNQTMHAVACRVLSWRGPREALQKAQASLWEAILGNVSRTGETGIQYYSQTT
jgi:hypothetical protein